MCGDKLDLMFANSTKTSHTHTHTQGKCYASTYQKKRVKSDKENITIKK